MRKQSLIHSDGRTVTLIDSGTDDHGQYILVEHVVIQQGEMNGPHWHPVLQEKFTVKEGIDGKETIVEQGGRVTIHPNETHQFWNVSDNRLIALHEVRPPGQHWKMFELIHKLECEGKLNKKGVPSNPLWLGVAWKCIDGYIVGPPRIVQTIFLGGLARLADFLRFRI